MSSLSIPPEYVHDGMTSRFLTASELPIRTGEERGPLVFEAKNSADLSYLKSFLSAHSASVKKALHSYGAIIFRGFKIETNHDFAEVILNIQGLRAMTDYFMPEYGRTSLNVPGTVFHTNKYFKTGGGVYLGGIHSENFYTTDVPEFVSFWCTKEPVVGGETALIHMANAYAELSDELKNRLEAESAFAGSYAIKDVSARYQVSAAAARELFQEVGLPISNSGEPRVEIYKPLVFTHPQTGRKSLQANLSVEVKGLDQFLSKLFLPSYSGPLWAIHRLGWKNSLFYTLLALVEMLPQLIRNPAILLELFHLIKKKNHDSKNTQKLNDRLSLDHVEALALAIWRHCYAFTWKRGDVLLFDNLQMLHTGMPGWGSRELRVMLCNPVALPYSRGSGVVEIPQSGGHQSVDERLRELSRRAGSAA